VAGMTAAQCASKKKALHAAARATARVRTVHTAFRDTVHALDVRRLQCVEASGTTLARTRRAGRATPGPRVGESVPVHEGEHDTLVAAVGLDGLHAPWGGKGAMSGAILYCGGHEGLGPPRQPGDIGLWAHLSAHKVAGGKRSGRHAARGGCGCRPRRRM
jgi:hypothetical protein